jgi:hypothetical protein
MFGRLSTFLRDRVPGVRRIACFSMFTPLRDATERRGMQMHAWTVFLHNSTLAGRYPDCAVRNVFGDAYVTDLCPANPEVRRYAVALAGDEISPGRGLPPPRRNEALLRVVPVPEQGGELLGDHRGFGQGAQPGAALG